MPPRLRVTSAITKASGSAITANHPVSFQR
jgi:hypothetical protein